MQSGDTERLLRAQLSYQAWSCALCQTRFLTFTDAQKHFTSRFSRHKGQKPAILENLDTDKESQLAQLLRSNPDQGHNRTAIDAALAHMDLSSFIAPPVPGKSEVATSVNTTDVSMETATNSSQDSSATASSLPISFAEQPFQSAENSYSDVSSSENSNDSLPVPAASSMPPPKPITRRTTGFTRKSRGMRCRECGLALAFPSQRDHLSRLHLDEPLFTCRRCPWTCRSQQNQEGRARHSESHGMATSDCLVDNTVELGKVLAALHSRLFQLTYVIQMRPNKPAVKRECLLCGEVAAGYFDQTKHIKNVHLASFMSPHCQLKKEHASNGHTNRSSVHRRPRSEAAVKVLHRRCFPGEERSRCEQCDQVVNARRRELHVSLRHQPLPSFTCRLCEAQFNLPHPVVIEHHLWVTHEAVVSELSCKDTRADAGFHDMLQLCFPETPLTPTPPTQSVTATDWRCASCCLKIRSKRPGSWEQHALRHHWEGWVAHCIPCKTDFNTSLIRHLESKHALRAVAADFVLSRRPALVELAKRLAGAASPVAGDRDRCLLDGCGMIPAAKERHRWHVVRYHWDGSGSPSCGECRSRCPTKKLRDKGERLSHCRLAWPTIRALRDKAFLLTYDDVI